MSIEHMVLLLGLRQAAHILHTHSDSSAAWGLRVLLKQLLDRPWVVSEVLDAELATK